MRVCPWSLSLSLSLRQRAWAWHLCFCCIQTSTSGIVFIEDIIDGTWALGLAARSNQTDVTATVPGARVIICKTNTRQCYHPLLSKEWLFSLPKERCHKKNILKLSFLIISICGSIWTNDLFAKKLFGCIGGHVTKSIALIVNFTYSLRWFTLLSDKLLKASFQFESQSQGQRDTIKENKTHGVRSRTTVLLHVCLRRLWSSDKLDFRSRKQNPEESIDHSARL